MFPDRMDKVVLDGVLNMHQYYTGLYDNITSSGSTKLMLRQGLSTSA
jgi:hypothetical protein